MKGSLAAIDILQDAALYLGGLPPACLFFIMGLSHFTHTDVFVALMPPYLPFHRFLVYCTGLLQICGSMGLTALPFFDSGQASNCCFALMTLVACMIPANVHSYANDIPVAGVRLEYNWAGHGLHFASLILLQLWLAGLALAHQDRPPLRERLFRHMHARRWCGWRPVTTSGPARGRASPINNFMEDLSRNA